MASLFTETLSGIDSPEKSPHEKKRKLKTVAAQKTSAFLQFFIQDYIIPYEFAKGKVFVEFLEINKKRAAKPAFFKTIIF